MLELELTFVGQNLDAKDSVLIGGKSDPYLILFQSGREVGRTTVIKNNLNPTWPPFTVRMDELTDTEYKIECWDKDKVGSDDLIGTATLTLEELLDDETNLQLISAKQKPSGKIRIAGSAVKGHVVTEEENERSVKDKSSAKKKSGEEQKPAVRYHKDNGEFRAYMVNPTGKPIRFTFNFSKCDNLKTKECIVVEPGKEEEFVTLPDKSKGKGYSLSFGYSYKNYFPPVADIKEDPGMFVDSEFAPHPASLGDVNTQVHKWFLARDLGERGSGVLFDGVDPMDVRQGALGDCWLMCSISCLASNPGRIRNLFTPKTLSADGKYTVKLFDVITDSWVDIEIDERVPCRVRDDEISPVFADPMGEEIWVPLLEKAFAKFYGAYATLDGGQTYTAMQAMTGAKDCSLYRVEGDHRTWTKYRFSVEDQVAKGARCPRFNALFRVKVDLSPPDALWTTIKTHVDAGDVLSTGIDKKDKSVKGEGEGNLGLVTGHAYSLLEAREVKVDSGERLKMVRLRNPWGNDKEWEGAWADGSPLWRANPKLAKRLKQASDEDGTFWMSWDDYRANFSKITVCHCGTKSRDVVCEELGERVEGILEVEY